MTSFQAQAFAVMLMMPVARASSKSLTRGEVKKEVGIDEGGNYVASMPLVRREKTRSGIHRHVIDDHGDLQEEDEVEFQNKAPDYELWSETELCKGGRWYPNAYAYAQGGGGTSTGSHISKEQAIATGIEYCAQAMADDSSCSKEWIGVAWNNGHCWCMPANSKCDSGTSKHRWQFKRKAGALDTQEDKQGDKQEEDKVEDPNEAGNLQPWPVTYSASQCTLDTGKIAPATTGGTITLAACQEHCQSQPSCAGFEFGPQRPEAKCWWVTSCTFQRPAVSSKTDIYLKSKLVEGQDVFLAAAWPLSYSKMLCRGANGKNPQVHGGIYTTLMDCQKRCILSPTCTAVEYGNKVLQGSSGIDHCMRVNHCKCWWVHGDCSQPSSGVFSIYLKPDCQPNHYLYAPGHVCLESCPPGYYERNDHQGRHCVECEGSTRRRSATQCTPCPDGSVGRRNHDECQNLQDTCDREQCLPCAKCLQEVEPALVKCTKRTNPNAQCMNPGEVWCFEVMTRLARCQSISIGCYLKLQCQSPCICKEWKDVHCGGQTGGDSGSCSSLMQLSAHDNMAALSHRANLMITNVSSVLEGAVSTGITDTHRLDDMLTDKCTG